MVARFAIVTGVLVAATGCRNGETVAPVEAPPYKTVFEAQESRLRKLELLDSSGVVELEWVDKDGQTHFEPQTDLKLLLYMPSHLAVRLRKFSTIMWLGSDEERFWFFDLLDEDDSVAWVGEFDDIDREGAIPGILHPARLLDLIGLTPLPEDAPLEWDAEEKAWRLEAQGRGGPVRMYLDPVRHWPVRVDSLDPEGRVIYQSRLSRYEPVEATGMPPSGFPRLPRRLVLDDVEGRGRAEITLGDPTTRITPDRVHQATDLTRLLTLLKPKRIEHLGEENGE